jgi:hypothetical protein
MLNRKEAMKTLLNQVTTKLHKTEEQIAHLRWSAHSDYFEPLKSIKYLYQR